MSSHRWYHACLFNMLIPILLDVAIYMNGVWLFVWVLMIKEKRTLRFLLSFLYSGNYLAIYTRGIGFRSPKNLHVRNLLSESTKSIYKVVWRFFKYHVGFMIFGNFIWFNLEVRVMRKTNYRKKGLRISNSCVPFFRPQVKVNVKSCWFHDSIVVELGK